MNKGFCLLFIISLYLALTINAEDLAPFQGNCFPSEKEVKSFVKNGMSKDKIIARFGPPSDQLPIENGEVILDYSIPPPKILQPAHYIYAGFSIYIKNDKVIDLTITHATYRP